LIYFRPLIWIGGVPGEYNPSGTPRSTSKTNFLKLIINEQKSTIMNQVNEKLRKSCEEAMSAFQKINKKEYKDLQSKLEWCIGSYTYDKNPSGLHQYGLESLTLLKKIKTKEPRKVNKKVIDNLEKAIQGFNKN
jgi:hypothetical protein